MFIEESWLKEFVSKMTRAFGERIEFIGLQGSNGRGEATEDSDIDMVVILDELTIQDLKKYNTEISVMTNRDKMCGFISGKQELLHWPKSDLFQFYFDTTPIVGNIDYLLTLMDYEDIKKSIQSGLGNIYHMCVHNFLHNQNEKILKETYKSATFVLRAIYFTRTSTFVKKNSDLLPLLREEEQVILNGYFFTKQVSEITADEFDELSEKLFNWSKKEIICHGDVPISMKKFLVN